MLYNKDGKIQNKKIIIIGLSKSGYNVAKLLAKDNEIILTDIKDDDVKAIDELKKLNVDFIKSDKQEDLVDISFDLMIRNPGVDPHNEVIKKAKSLKIPILNEMEVAYHYLPKNTKIIGITGSNGKTTVTTMIYDILSKQYDNVYLGGNIGYPLSEIVNEIKDNSILVLEISDHQLYDFIDFKTDISVLTNLCPTHLDFHDNYENYVNAKKKIFNHHDKNNIAIINFMNKDSISLTKDINSKKLFFNGNNAYVNRNAIYVNNEFILDIDSVKLKGNHNYENIMATLLVINEFNLNKDLIREYYKTFDGVEHRLEFVREINKVKYYNDSKSTNPTSTITAINSFDGNIHLILGGYERKQDFNELNEVINKVKCIYAIGETSQRVYDYAASKNIDCINCNTLSVALDKIKEKVEENDVVLLSPASASWDQYKKFEQRGDEFKKIVCEM